MSIRRDPFEAMERMFEQMRRGDVPDGPFATATSGRGFDANVSMERDEDAFVVLADLPGFEREEIDLTYADGVLTMSGSHEDRDEDSLRARTVRETVAMPEDVDAEAIEATYRNGVLEVRLPVSAADASGYRIDIE